MFKGIKKEYECGHLVVTMSVCTTFCVKPKFRLDVEICHCMQETLTPWWR